MGALRRIQDFLPAQRAIGCRPRGIDRFEVAGDLLETFLRFLEATEERRRRQIGGSSSYLSLQALTLGGELEVALELGFTRPGWWMFAAGKSLGERSASSALAPD